LIGPSWRPSRQRKSPRPPCIEFDTWSHELRTPLNSIIGFADLLIGQGVGPLIEKQARYLTHIHNSGKHLLQLISDILDLSKVEAGKFVLQPEALTVGSTLEDILVIGRGLAHKKSQTVKAEIQAGLPPLRVDAVRFKQILFNLLSNAVKFTPESGLITVTARKVDQSTGQVVDSSRPVDQLTTRPIDTAGEWLEIAVTDTGIGITAADLPRLFREFTQLDPAAAKTHEGTGLGLVLTRRLVELHGGRVWADSEGEGRGSTFVVLAGTVRKKDTK
jgi:Amt family ammonium transporter